MAAPQIKICGITDPAALEAAIGARADHVGLVFFAPSPRNLAFADAAALAGRVAGRASKVGVFVDPSDDLLAQAIAAASLDALQLHEVGATRRAAIRARFGLPVWAVVAVRRKADLAGPFEQADRVIFDAKTPHGSALPGGMGLKFDWSWLAGLRSPFAWGLAGGLTPANVAEAISVTGAPLVDTSSGVETAPGVKDVDRIAAFCKAARR